MSLVSAVDRPYPRGYNCRVLQLKQTDSFAKWLVNLRNTRAKARILARLDFVRLGNLGDVKSIGGGVSEIRIDVGAGYRVYFTRRHRIMIILLVGGDKGSQTRDIARAKLMAKEIE